MLPNKSRFPKVLFFISGANPTAAQQLSSVAFGPGVSFRNVLHLDPTGAVEECDAVTGDVPPKPSPYASLPAAIPYTEWVVEQHKILAAELATRAANKAATPHQHPHGQDKPSTAVTPAQTTTALGSEPPRTGATAPAPSSWKPNA